MRLQPYTVEITASEEDVAVHLTYYIFLSRMREAGGGNARTEWKGGKEIVPFCLCYG